MNNDNEAIPSSKKDPHSNPDPNQQERNGHQSFQVQNTPKGIFPLFYETSDPYIYDKKFYCDLPQVITPTKSFHYPFSMESFCQFDLLTMVFDLKKNCEILTDPKLNTLIHQDFINNSLELISPNLTQATTQKVNTDQLKRDILEIVERQEDVQNEKKTAMHNRSFYLRNSTYFRTSLNVKADNQGLQAKRKNRTMSDSIPRISTEEAKKIIAKTFNDIHLVQVGKEHPRRPGVTAKNVYDVLPYTKLGGNDFCQFIFPIDPSQEAMVNEKFEKPEKFIMKKKANEEDIYSLYLNEHLKNSEKTNERSNAEYYSYDKDYTISSAHPSVLFNRFLIFVNREKKTAKFASISNKYTLKKFKRPFAHKTEEGDEEDDDNFLKRKRERDIVVIPKEIDEANLLKRNQWIKQNGFPFQFVGQDIQDIDYTEVEQIKKEKHIEEMHVSDDEGIQNVNLKKRGEEDENEEEDDEEEDYFGQGNDEEGSYNNDRHSDAHDKFDDSSHNDNNESQSGNENKHREDKEEEDEDALFSEKEEQIEEEDRNAKDHPKKPLMDEDEGNE